MSIASKTAERPLRHIPIVTDLNDQWRRLNFGDESAPQVQASLDRWRQMEPFRRVLTLEDVLDAIQEDPDKGLLALIEASQSGDSIAARTIIQTMLPKLICIAKSQSSYFHFGPSGPSPLDELVTMGVSVLWELIASYPVDRRPTSVAGNLSLDLLKRIRQETKAGRCEHPYDPTDISRLAQSDSDESRGVAAAGQSLQKTLAQATGAAVSDELAATLQSAVDAQLVDLDEISFLVSYYFEGGAKAAARTGLSPGAVRVRSHRLCGRLRREALELTSTH